MKISKVVLAGLIALSIVGLTACGGANENSRANTQSSVGSSSNESSTNESKTDESSTNESKSDESSVNESKADESSSENSKTKADNAEKNNAKVYEGTYAEKIAGRGIITLSVDENENCIFHIKWASSAFETSEWDFSCKMDDNGHFRYDNCKNVLKKYDETGAETVEEVYTNGTGSVSISISDDGTYTLSWDDEMNHVADDTVFIKFDEISTNESKTDESSTNESKQDEGSMNESKADESSSENSKAETDNGEKNNVEIYEGTYAEKIAGRGIIKLSVDENENCIFHIEWASSAFETSEWDFSCKMDDDGHFRYDNCKNVHKKYDETGAETAEEVYTNGTGSISISIPDDGTYTLSWDDEMDHVADDAVFIKQ